MNVTTVGETNDFPAFYSPKSGFKVRSPTTVTRAVRLRLPSFSPLSSSRTQSKPHPFSVSPVEAHHIPRLTRAMVDTSLSLPTPQAQLFACPIPSEYHAQGKVIQKAVEQAVRESREQGVDKRGKEVTPWLLKRVGELTQGKALQSSESVSDVSR